MPVDLADYIRSIRGFPKPGILFRDITPLLASPQAFAEAIDQMAEHYRDQRIDTVVSAEARGFIFAAPLALKLGAGFVPARKKGKLPFDTLSIDYELEYGTDSLQIHIDGVARDKNVLIVDDLLATGGTVGAIVRLVEKAAGNIVGCCFLIEIAALGGARRLAPYPIFSLIKY
jgi:adenine phosphoribosyltransferase